MLKNSPMPESIFPRVSNNKSNCLANLKPIKLDLNLNKIERKKFIGIKNKYQFKRHVPTKSILDDITLDESIHFKNE